MFQRSPNYPGPTPTYDQHPYITLEDTSTPSGAVKNTYEESRFRSRERVNDIAFLILFVLQLVVCIALSVIILRMWIARGEGIGSKNGQPLLTLNRRTIYLLLLVTAASVLLSVVYLMLVRIFTKVIMHITLPLTILLNIGICVFLYISRLFPEAIAFTVIAILSALSYFGFRSRIPLASLLLQVVIDITRIHTSVYVVTLVALLLQAVLGVWFALTALATYVTFAPGHPFCDTSGCSTAKAIGLMVFETFSLLWTSQVIGNVALATLAGGPFGCWYYFGPRNLSEMSRPKLPTVSAFKRASSYSLGSIAFGSLIVTLLELLKLLSNAVQNNADASGHPVEACLACCASCFVDIIEGFVEYFNRYAYIQIALYGKPYIAAAKDTWKLFRDRGIDALVNDSLVGMTLMWGGYAIGLLSALFAYLYLRFTAPSYNATGQYTTPILVFSFLLGFFCSSTASSAIEAGVSTIFVGLGEDPEVLAIRAPNLFAMISDTYPDVTRPVPR